MARPKRNEKLQATLCGAAFVKYGKMDYPRMAHDCGCCEVTMRRRIADPGTITIDELRRMAKVFGITTEDLHAAIKV